MSYYLIEDFRHGIDLRKSVFTAPPGSLRRLVNANITAGGEIEKAKTWVVFAALPPEVHGLFAVGDQLHTFGSVAQPTEMPRNIRYNRIQAADTAAGLTRILDAEVFNGKVYVIAEFDNGAVHHFYNQARVIDWDTISTNNSDNDTVAQVLAQRLAQEAPMITSSDGATLIITAPDFNRVLTVTTGPTGTTQTLTATEVQTPTKNRPSVWSVVVGGTFNGASIFSVTIGYGGIVGGPPTYDLISNGEFTADLNGWVSDPPGGWVWDAGQAVNSDPSEVSSLSQPVASLNAPTGVPVTWIGMPINWTGVPITWEVDVAHTSGAGSWRLQAVDSTGVAAPQTILTIPSGSQIAGAIYFGEFPPTHDTIRVVTVSPVSVRLNSVRVQQTLIEESPLNATVKIQGRSVGMGRACMTFGDKMYSVTQSLLYFSGFSGTPPKPDPTKWLNATGSGFINMATQSGASSDLIGLGKYQNAMAVFSRRDTQIWNIDPDPALNARIQVLDGIGAVATRSIHSFGDVDLFFLSDTGVRSLRARDSTNIASAQDVGSPIDSEIIQLLLQNPRLSRAVAIVDPTTGRYLLSLGDRIYAFSHFPGSQISAWSTYVGLGAFTDFAIAGNRLYALSEQTVYLLGGANGMEFDDGSLETEVWLPFMDAESPATQKGFTGLDIGCEGKWDVYLHPNPAAPDVFEYVGSVDGTTFGFQPRFPISGQGTHFSLRFTHRGEGYARLANVVVHYNSGEAG